MKNYSVTMEFTGHHQINFQAKNNGDAVRMVENGELYDKDKKVLFYQDEIHESEECIPIVETIRIKNEDKGVRYI